MGNQVANQDDRVMLCVMNIVETTIKYSKVQGPCTLRKHIIITTRVYNIIITHITTICLHIGNPTLYFIPSNINIQ